MKTIPKPRFEGAPGGAELGKRLDALCIHFACYGRSVEALADALGISMATLYRWRAGSAKRISRYVARELATLEEAAKR
jgi:hypothetical protein